ncbi:single-stranded DNA-binding protein [Ruegeria sp. HU-ET01832]|uniref:single-stranded DNA-binding protein n=1 Tax=Ruegeria sp. HU-ET01832 TaxID=3135906 RepID=UPI003103C3A5
MAGVNKVVLVGNLGRDPQINEISIGKKVCNLSLATNERWKDRASGELKSRTLWHSVAVYREDLVKVAEQLPKGAKIYVEGKIQTRSWSDKAGEKRYRTEVVLDGFACKLFKLEREQTNEQERPSEPINAGSQISNVEDWDLTDPPF